jgi:hypothetical protein
MRLGQKMYRKGKTHTALQHVRTDWLLFVPGSPVVCAQQVNGSPKSTVQVSLRVIVAVLVLAEHELEGLTGGVRR